MLLNGAFAPPGQAPFSHHGQGTSAAQPISCSRLAVVVWGIQLDVAAEGVPVFILLGVQLALQDRSFTFILKTPPASDLLKKAAKVRAAAAAACLIHFFVGTVVKGGILWQPFD